MRYRHSWMDGREHSSKRNAILETRKGKYFCTQAVEKVDCPPPLLLLVNIFECAD